MANRLWAMMMGRGLVHPLDLHHSGNPPSHPKLLDLLARRFAESNYDTKAFLRELAISETYGRSSIVPDGIDAEKVPPESFAVANMKGLSPEQLFGSLMRATASEKLFETQIEDALKEDEEAYTKLLADKSKLAEARAGKRAERVKEFVRGLAMRESPTQTESNIPVSSAAGASSSSSPSGAIPMIAPRWGMVNPKVTDMVHHLASKRPTGGARRSPATRLSRVVYRGWRNPLGRLIMTDTASRHEAIGQSIDSATDELVAIRPCPTPHLM